MSLGCSRVRTQSVWIAANQIIGMECLQLGVLLCYCVTMLGTPSPITFSDFWYVLQKCFEQWVKFPRVSGLLEAPNASDCDRICSTIFLEQHSEKSCWPAQMFEGVNLCWHQNVKKMKIRERVSCVWWDPGWDKPTMLECTNFVNSAMNNSIRKPHCAKHYEP